MVDVSKIKINNTLYNFKDTTARNNLSKLGYESMDSLKANITSNTGYAFLSDGSLWKIKSELDSEESINNIDIFSTTIDDSTLYIQLVVRTPLCLDYLLHGGATFSAAIIRGFELSKKIICSAREYTVNNVITIPEGCTLQGAGAKATTLSVSQVGNNIVVKNYATVCDIGIYGTEEGAFCISLTSNGPSLINCNFSGLYKAAIVVESSTESGIIKECNIKPTRSTSEEIYGLWLSQSNRLFVKDLFIQNCREGIRFDSGEGNQKFCGSSCKITNCSYCIHTISNVQSCFFSDCQFDSTTYGVSIISGTDINFVNCSFSGENAIYGCSITSSKGIKFTGCTFINNQKWGCIIEYNSADCSFHGCTFGKNGWASSSTTYGGLKICGKSTTVSGCVFSNELTSGDSSTENCYGIYYAGTYSSIKSQYHCYVGNIYTTHSPVGNNNYTSNITASANSAR